MIILRSFFHWTPKISTRDAVKNIEYSFKAVGEKNTVF